MATTTPPRKLRLVVCKDPPNPMAGVMTLLMGFGEKAVKWVRKREVGEGFDGRGRRFERVGLVVVLKIMVLEAEEERGDEDLRMCKPILRLTNGFG